MNSPKAVNGAWTASWKMIQPFSLGLIVDSSMKGQLDGLLAIPSGFHVITHLYDCGSRDSQF